MLGKSFLFLSETLLEAVFLWTQFYTASWDNRSTTRGRNDRKDKAEKVKLNYNLNLGINQTWNIATLRQVYFSMQDWMEIVSQSVLENGSLSASMQVSKTNEKSLYLYLQISTTSVHLINSSSYKTARLISIWRHRISSTCLSTCVSLSNQGNLKISQSLCWSMPLIFSEPIFIRPNITMTPLSIHRMKIEISW